MKVYLNPNHGLRIMSLGLFQIRSQGHCTLIEGVVLSNEAWA